LRFSDDVAYVAPMAVFLALTGMGDHFPQWFPQIYAIKTFAAAMLLWIFRGHYTAILWKWWWLGIVFGVVGVVQWVGMESFILGHWPHYPRMSHEPYIPTDHLRGAHLWAFLVVRWSGASLVVPVMEELFWRDFLWRTLLAPNDFKLAAIGEWSLSVFLIVAIAFGAGVHIEWATAIVWGLMIGALLAWTKSLGACIVCHAATNFLLGAYVLYSGQWGFW